MRYTTKRNGKNVIPLLMAVCGINLPYWRIDRADDLHSYLSGDAADKLAAYEDAEEQGRLVILPCKVGDTVFVITERGFIAKGEVRNFHFFDKLIVDVEYHHFGTYATSRYWGETVFLSRAEAEAALKGEREDV